MGKINNDYEIDATAPLFIPEESTSTTQSKEIEQKAKIEKEEDFIDFSKYPSLEVKGRTLRYKISLD